MSSLEGVQFSCLKSFRGEMIILGSVFSIELLQFKNNLHAFLLGKSVSGPNRKAFVWPVCKVM